MAFGFRIRFLAPPGTALEEGKTGVQLHLPGAPGALVVKQHNSLPINSVVLTVDGDGFAQEKDAREFGVALKSSLAVYSARQRHGFDLGQNVITSSTAQHIRQKIRQERGVDLRPTVHGLDVFDSSVPVHRLEMSARLSVIRSIANLPADLASDFRYWDFSPKLTLALELYNGCKFAVESEVRFLSLVTVVEVLAERSSIPTSAAEFIDCCISKLVQTQLSSDNVNDLKSRLGNLKKQSIGIACRLAVAEAGADVNLFKRCYKARSELLHDGVCTSYPDLPRQPHLLDGLVHAVLLHRIDASA